MQVPSADLHNEHFMKLTESSGNLILLLAGWLAISRNWN